MHNKKALLSQQLRDVVVNFDTCVEVFSGIARLSLR